MDQIITDIQEIYFAGLTAVDPCQLVHNALFLDRSRLCVALEPTPLSLDIDDFDTIKIIGAGKATARMALGIESLFKNRPLEGVIAVKSGFTERLNRIKVIAAAHPVPDEAGVQAANAVKEIARRATERDLVIGLFSGGGSALLPSPISYHVQDKTYTLSLEEKQRITSLLLKSGASIDEINCIRKHLSSLKGGRLAKTLYPARSINLFLSDVISNRLDVIASGPTTPDRSTFSQMSELITKYQLTKGIDPKISQIMSLGIKGVIPETPGLEDPVFARVTNHIIGDNHLCLQGALKKAIQLGYRSKIVRPEIVGEARIAANTILKAISDEDTHSSETTPHCFIFGGETTVTVKGNGKGGRNQELTLAFLSEIQRNKDLSQRSFLLSASTDGDDGPTDAAGAFSSQTIINTALAMGLNPDQFLDNNDSFHFFKATDGLFQTGPSNTNVCDIQIVVILPR